MDYRIEPRATTGRSLVMVRGDVAHNGGAERGRDRVTVVLPARPEMWSVLRLVASALGAQLDFSLDDIEDLRLAINELCTACASGATVDSELTCTLMWGDGGLEVVCCVAGVSEPKDDSTASLLELSAQILAAVTTDYQLDPISGDTCQGMFRKVRSSPT